MPQRLLKSLTDNTGTNELKLTFRKNISLSLVPAEGYDTLREIKRGNTLYAGLNNLVKVNPSNERVWLVSYTSGPRLKGKRVDDELVVVIETREDPDDPTPPGKRAPKKPAKKATTAKVAKQKPAKPASAKKKPSKKKA